MKGSRIVLPFPVARGRALVFPARMPDSHRLPFAIVFGPRVVRYRLNAHLSSPHHISRKWRQNSTGVSEMRVETARRDVVDRVDAPRPSAVVLASLAPYRTGTVLAAIGMRW